VRTPPFSLLDWKGFEVLAMVPWEHDAFSVLPSPGLLERSQIFPPTSRTPDHHLSPSSPPLLEASSISLFEAFPSRLSFPPRLW